MASYFILRPLRDTMGTVYGVKHLQDLFTGTFLVSFIVAPIFAGFASRIRLATFLPWVYGFIAITMVIFYILFQRVANDRWVAAAFYIWLSTFNLLTISVFWSLMADIFSSPQAKRLFGVIAAGGTLGTVVSPAFITIFVKTIGTNNLLLISAAGFVICAFLVRLLEAQKRDLIATDTAAQKTTLEQKPGRQPVRRFRPAVPVPLPFDDRAVPAADDLHFHGDLFSARRSHHQGILPAGRHAPRPTPRLILRRTALRS